MKKIIIASAIAILLIIPFAIFFSEGLVYLITALMALIIIGTIMHNSSLSIQITRWAKAKPRKAQLLITFLQIVLMALGIFAGNNFRELGYKFSDTAAIVFSSTIVLGFLFVPFLSKRNSIALPVAVNKQRFGFTVIALSSFVMMVITGNRIGQSYPNSPVTHAVMAVDHAIFKDGITLPDEASDPNRKSDHEDVLMKVSSSVLVFASILSKEKEQAAGPDDPKKKSKADIKAEKKIKKFEKRLKKLINRLNKKRLLAAGGSTAGSVFLIILLVITTCAGICLVIGGVASLSSGNAAGLLLLLAGGLIAWFSIKGIKNIRKQTEPQKPDP